MRIHRAARCAAVLLLLASAADAAPLTADEADALVRARWFEDMPEDRIAPLSGEAVAHLDALLRDPAEAQQHAACVELLGRAGGPGAFAALEAFAGREPVGEVEAATYRARLALPLAWGAMAQRDPRALDPLLALARADAAAPTWRFRRLDSSGVHALRRSLARTALRGSGRGGPEVEAVLSEPAPRSGGAGEGR